VIGQGSSEFWGFSAKKSSFPPNWLKGRPQLWYLHCLSSLTLASPSECVCCTASHCMARYPQTQKQTGDLDFWPITLIFHKLQTSEVVTAHVRAKFHQAKCSGSWVVVFTVKIGDAFASAGSNHLSLLGECCSSVATSFTFWSLSCYLFTARSLVLDPPATSKD